MRSLATELGIDSYIEFAGSQPPAEVAEYMKSSTLLVLPSRHKAFGAALIEALTACIEHVISRLDHHDPSALSQYATEGL